MSNTISIDWERTRDDQDQDENGNTNKEEDNKGSAQNQGGPNTCNPQAKLLHINVLVSMPICEIKNQKKWHWPPNI
jgi:hypothetical protein